MAADIPPGPPGPFCPRAEGAKPNWKRYAKMDAKAVALENSGEIPPVLLQKVREKSLQFGMTARIATRTSQTVNYYGILLVE